jgi:hypothetical protein
VRLGNGAMLELSVDVNNLEAALRAVVAVS